MSKSDSEYRRELEKELERLTKELNNVRVQKSKQKQRIEQLHQEQTQMHLGNTSTTTSTSTTTTMDDAALAKLVQQKKMEHSTVKQEWHKSQEEYRKMTRNAQDPNVSASTQDFLDSMWGSMVEGTGGESSFGAFEGSFSKDFDTMPDPPVYHQDEEAEAEAAADNEDDYDGNDDGGTVITEHTKDSLQVYRKSKDHEHPRRAPRGEDGGNGEAPKRGGLGNFFEKEKKKEGSTQFKTKLKGSNGSGGGGSGSGSQDRGGGAME